MCNVWNSRPWRAGLAPKTAGGTSRLCRKTCFSGKSVSKKCEVQPSGSKHGSFAPRFHRRHRGLPAAADAARPLAGHVRLQSRGEPGGGAEHFAGGEGDDVEAVREI